MSVSDKTDKDTAPDGPARKTAEEKYGTVVRTAMDGFLLVDKTGRIIDANEAYCRMSGYAREELTAMHVADIEAAESPEDVAAHIRKVIELGSERFETRHRRKDGTTIELEVNTTYLNIDVGYFFTFFKDLTELKKNETELRVLSSAIEQSPTAVLITDAVGVIEYVNPRFEDITGYTAAELKGKKPGVLKSGVHPPEFYKEMWATITSGRPWQGDICNQRKNGELYWESRSISPIKNNSGAITHYVGMQIEDIERKKVEDRLRRSEEKLAEAQKIAHLGNWEWDIAADELWWSDETYRIFGVEREAFGATYESFLDAVHPDDVDDVRKTMARALEDKTPYKMLYRIKKSGKDVRVIHSRGKVLIDENGAAAGIRGTAQDITECKQMEEELHKAQKLESLGVLGGGIAHEFNNILTGIVGNMFLIKKASPGNDAVKERLAVIDSAITRAKGLTHKLLTFSNGGSPVKQAIDMERLASDTARLVFGGSRVKYSVNGRKGLWTVKADEGQIDQVLQNIFINALQAMPEGGSVTVDMENSPGPAHLGGPEGSYVKTTITDNGPGIPGELTGKVFDPFFTTKPGGSGLGLSIVFSVVRKHSGFVNLESGVNTGSSFIVYLPAVKTAPPQKMEPLAVLLSPSGARRRVLVMDDEEMVRDTAEAILTELGYEPVLSASGLEALDIYAKGMEAGTPIDLVIMDLTVHDGMGGAEAISRLLAVDPGARAIVSSGYCNSPIMSDYEKYGFKGVLQKPYDVSEFSTAVKKALGEA